MIKTCVNLSKLNEKQSKLGQKVGFLSQLTGCDLQ